MGDPLRKALIILGNTLRILFFDSFGSWRRDFRYFAPALASISLVLIMGGSMGVLAFAGYQLLQAQTRDASVLTVYLIDSDRASVDGLVSRLKSDQRVGSVTYVSKQETCCSAKLAWSEPRSSLWAATASAISLPSFSRTSSSKLDWLTFLRQARRRMGHVR